MLRNLGTRHARPGSCPAGELRREFQVRKEIVLLWALLNLTSAFGSVNMNTPSVGKPGGSSYIEAWKNFYPGRACDEGMLASIFDFEDYSQARIRDWIQINRAVLSSAWGTEADEALEERIDARLLRIQARFELMRWEEEAPQRNSPGLYAEVLAGSVNRVLASTALMPDEKSRLIKSRLSGMRRMCAAARAQLKDGSPGECQRALKLLESSANGCAMLPERMSDLIPPAAVVAFAADCKAAAADLGNLATWIRSEILPQASLSESPILGADRFARQLRIYTDSSLTPEQVEELASTEIKTVRGLMDELASSYLKQAEPGKPLPANFDVRVGQALADMEMNRPRSESEYLERLRVFAADAERFVRERGIATLSAHQSLTLALAPESSGPMARIGYVDPAPAFHPNPWTTWYLATIPDSFPAAERENFWRSFNYHFKRFVVMHELFPGHYLQSQIARENTHPVRILFPYGPYEEGWATLCERVALDAGWADGDPLTRLAQLRKRLENANRAYTSVQVHCRGWNEEQVLKFSRETSLVAPQFAKSLWGRLLSSPMQITTYFLGYRMFSEVYEMENKRLGDRFKIRRFMDTILRAGPIPIDAFPEIFRNFQN
jgi:hypothetical protein